MQWLEGVAAGFEASREARVAREMALAQSRAEREGAIYSALLQSDNEEVRRMALAGLLEGARLPRPKVGIPGWMGQMEENPIYQKLTQFLQTPQRHLVDRVIPAGLPSGQGTGLSYLPTPPTQHPAALPASSPTEPGGAPLTPVAQLPDPVEPEPTAQASLPFLAPRLFQPTPPPRPPLFGQTPAPTEAPIARDALFAPGLGELGAPRLQPTPGFGSAISQEVPAEPQPVPPSFGFQTVGAPPPQYRTEEVSRLPDVYPTEASLTAQREQAQVMGQVAGWQQLYKLMGEPNWQMRGVEAALRQRQGAAGLTPYGFIPGELFDDQGNFVRSGFITTNRATGAMEFDNAPVPPGYSPRPRAFASQVGGTRYEADAARDLGFRTVDEAFQAGPEAWSAVQARARERRAQEILARPIDVRTAALTGTQVGLPNSAYSGQRIPSPQDIARARNAVALRAMLADIQNQFGGVLPSQAEWFGGTFPGWANWLNQRNPAQRVPLANLQSSINNIQAQITRVMQGNVGTQTEQDARRALYTLADIEGDLLDPARGDTAESAWARIQVTISYLDAVSSGIPPLPVPTPDVGAPTGAPTGPPPPANPATPEIPPTGFFELNGQMYYNGRPI